MQASIRSSISSENWLSCVKTVACFMCRRSNYHRVTLLRPNPTHFRSRSLSASHISSFFLLVLQPASHRPAAAESRREKVRSEKTEEEVTGAAADDDDHDDVDDDVSRVR